MERLQAYKFRIYPSADQEQTMVQIAGCCRLVYNLGLEQRTLFYRRGVRTFSYLSQANELPALKAEFPFLKIAPAQSLQVAIRQLDTAFQRFFDGHASYPTYKSRRSSLSFTFPDPKQVRVDWHRSKLVLPKFGKSGSDHGALNLRAHRALKGKIRQITISCSGGMWFASILVKRRVADLPESPIHSAGQVVGVDRGIVSAIVTDQGDKFNVNGTRQGSVQRQKRLNQKLARQKLGSANRQRTIKRLQAVKAREARRRRDQINKITSHLVKNHDLIVIEDLKVQNMSRSAKGTLREPGSNVAAKSGLNRAILDKGWGEVRRQLNYKAAWAGKQVLEISPVNTSRTCPECGHVSADNRRSQAVFDCTSCGYLGNADQIAAFNIKQRGLAMLGLPPATVPPVTPPKDVRCQPVESSCASSSVKQESKPVKVALLGTAA